MLARAGADIVNGLLGDDTLRGLIGVDTMSDEDGNDAVYGGRRNDRLLATTGCWVAMAPTFSAGSAILSMQAMARRCVRLAQQSGRR